MPVSSGIAPRMPATPARQLDSGSHGAYSSATAAPIAAPASVNTAHQPKTMAYAVPVFTLLTQVKPMAVSTSVQIMKMSSAEAMLNKNTPSAGFIK